MFGVVLYEKQNFIITTARGGYVVYNKEKPFEDGHTHLKKFSSCKSAIYLALNKQIPKGNNVYFLDSLIRISTDKNYINRLFQRIVHLKCGRKVYTNKKRGGRKL